MPLKRSGAVRLAKRAHINTRRAVRRFRCFCPRFIIERINTLVRQPKALTGSHRLLGWNVETETKARDATAHGEADLGERTRETCGAVMARINTNLREERLAQRSRRRVSSNGPLRHAAALVPRVIGHPVRHITQLLTRLAQKLPARRVRALVGGPRSTTAAASQTTCTAICATASSNVHGNLKRLHCGVRVIRERRHGCEESNAQRKRPWL